MKYMDSNQPASDSRSTLLFQLEKDIAILLINNLESYNLTLERASQIAKFILLHLPDALTDEQVMQIVPSLDDEFYELAGIVFKYLYSYETSYKDLAQKQLEGLIRHKHFADASKLATDYFKRKFIPAKI